MSSQSRMSPSCPSRSADACMDVAEKIYKDYVHAYFTAAEAASAANLSATSGTFKGLFSDLKQYGMIEKAGPSSFCITQEVKDYVSAVSENSEELSALRYGFSLCPVFFQKLLETLHGKLPDVVPLSNILMSQHGFNKRKAQDTARALSDSLNWAGALDGKRNIISPARSAKQRGELPDDKASDGSISFSETGEIAGPARVRQLKMELPLANGRVAQIAYPSDLSQNEASMIATVLRAIVAGDGVEGQ